ncbi:MAG: hypothetical protein DCO99_06170 [Synechococcus sp. XM-24]|nr:MAG: hypothetical protein DCO99_06170 [Synechococcus sp. XM-24]
MTEIQASLQRIVRNRPQHPPNLIQMLLLTLLLMMQAAQMLLVAIRRLIRLARRLRPLLVFKRRRFLMLRWPQDWPMPTLQRRLKPLPPSIFPI